MRIPASKAGQPEYLPPKQALELSLSAPGIPAPSLSFDGISNADNFSAFGFHVGQPNTNGDVGPNHYVQQVNLLVRVFSKQGAALTDPFKLSSLWAAGGPAASSSQCAQGDAGDSVVLYDPLADRWLLSQIAFRDRFLPPYHQCIAISQTADPAGAYYLYDFVLPGSGFPDHPKLGVWPDGYYMAVNQLLGADIDGTGVYAFDRQKMLLGNATAGFIYFNLNLASYPDLISGMLPSDLDGLNPPPAGRPNTFACLVSNEFGPADALRLFDFHADFTNPASSSFTERADSFISVAPFDPRNPSGRGDIEQPGTIAALDSVSERLMHRLQYRNFGSSESLVTNHTVNVGTGTTLSTHQAGVRYYELRSPIAGAFTVNEQATFAPDTDNRWMGSAAMDNDGNLAVGFSVSSATIFPSIRYAGRLVTDPAGGLFQGENTIAEGTGVQTSTQGWWGEHSALVVDPIDDCSFWYTNEYYTAESQASSPAGWLTRIGTFRFSQCTDAEQARCKSTLRIVLPGSPSQARSRLTVIFTG